MKNNSHLLLVYGVFLVASCRKTPAAPPIIHMFFAPHAMDYIRPAASNYFIYRDSASGILDSMTVATNRVDTLYQSAVQEGTGPFALSVAAYYYQFYTLLLEEHDPLNGSITHWFYGNARSNEPACLCGSGTAGLAYETDSLDLLFIEDDPNTTLNLGVSFTYPLSLGQGVSILTLTIENKVYSNVAVFTSDSLSLPPHPDSPYLSITTFWARGIGIIKRTVITAGAAQTWTLLRSG